MQRGIKCASNRVEVIFNELLVAVKGRERRPNIPSIYAQRLFMGFKYIAATS